MKKWLFIMKEYIYNKISVLPDSQKTESLYKYSEYLRKEILNLKIYSYKLNDFKINYLFSYFNKGIKLLFDFENLECIYYNTLNKVSGKCYIPNNEFEFYISSKKIGIKVFGIELEINDLEDSKIILNRLKKILDEKLITTKIILEPCYSLIKNKLIDKEDIKKNSINNNIIRDDNNDDINTYSKNHFYNINNNI